MASITIHRLTDSCLIVDTGAHSALFDPGFFTWGQSSLDLAGLPEVDRVLITHEHGDHFVPEFVEALGNRYPNAVVQSNSSVVGILAKAGMDATADTPDWVQTFDIPHEMVPTGTVPPNLGYTVDAVFTHPGDSYRLEASAPVLGLPVMAPWGSTTQSVEYARRLRPRFVVPLHDFFLTPEARTWLYGMLAGVLEKDGIQFVPLQLFESRTIDL